MATTAVKRVLLVDDEADIREVARVSLEMVGGWKVDTASSGREALDQARTDIPDAIILDVMMPGMDGPTTFGLIREVPELQKVPVILLTAKVQPADKARFIELGVNGLIAKPFDPMSLPGEIREILGWF